MARAEAKLTPAKVQGMCDAFAAMQGQTIRYFHPEETKDERVEAWFFMGESAWTVTATITTKDVPVHPYGREIIASSLDFERQETVPVTYLNRVIAMRDAATDYIVKAVN